MSHDPAMQADLVAYHVRPRKKNGRNNEEIYVKGCV